MYCRAAVFRLYYVMSRRPSGVPNDVAEIRRLREAGGVSQAVLAARAGISQQHLSLIERGSIVPRLNTLRTILACLGLEMEVKTAARADVWTRYNRWQEERPDELSPGKALSRIGELGGAFQALHPSHETAESLRGKAFRIKAARLHLSLLR